MSGQDPKREGSDSIDVTMDGVVKDVGQWKNTTLVTIFARYIASQPFTNVLLCVGVVGFYWAVHYGLTVAIPDDRRMIQSLIREGQEADKEERQKDRQQYDNWIRYIIDQHNGTSSNFNKQNSVLNPTGSFSSRE